MPPTVFISYSHKDKAWKDRLLTHLKVSEKEGHLSIWEDRQIAAGTGWREEIQKAIDTAEIGILLISADFLTSDFVRGEEIPRMLERRSKNGMRLFPVLIRSCDWPVVTWLEPMQIRPNGARPLADFRGDRRDAEMAAIAREIRGFLPSKTTPTDSTSNTATAPTLPSLHQLPAPPADFTGREKDLEALRSALTQGGTGAIFGLRGLAGVGKTTLALKLAEELTPRYPNAQIYLDLRGVDPQPLTVTQAMAHVVRSFHPDMQLPEDETVLPGLYRSVLFGKTALLLMDNAASREQVEPLIPPAGSLLLVTSRFHFTLPGLVARDLDKMNKEDARDLLLRMEPRIGNESDEIARLCGYLPLALRLAGSVLAERKDLHPVEYKRLLKEGKAQFGPVDASLSLSYKLLKDDQKQRWRRLAVFPGTFAATAAAAVWELEIDAAKEAISELVRCSLVEWEEKEERYRLHDLARQFADRQSEAVERDTTQRLHAKHFLKVLGAADALYLKGGEAVLLAVRLFDVEWGNVQSGYTWAANHFLEDDEAARICGDYPEAGAYLLSLRLHPREQIRWRETALAASRRRNDKAQEGRHLGGLGLAYAALGQPRRAIEFYEQWLAIARDLGDRRGEGSALGNLGIAYLDLGEPRRAIEFYEQHLAIARDIGDRRGEGQALGNLGSAYATLGEPHRAVEFYEQQLTITRDIGDRRGEGNAIWGLGLAYAALGEPRRAIEFYEQHLAIARDIGDRFGEAQASWNLGLVYEEEGDLIRGADLMQVLVDFEQEIGHPDAEKDAADVQALRARIAEQS